MTTELKISGASCDNCKNAIETALKGVPGVENVVFSLEEGQATVEGEVASAMLISAVVDAGFEAELHSS